MESKHNIITAIYREHWHKLYVHALNLLGDSENASDVVNDVFCQVLEDEKRIDCSRDNLLPIFYVMVRNRCIDVLRHESIVRRNEDRYIADLYSGWSNEDYRDYEERIEKMQACIRNMAPQMRKVLSSYFLEGHTCSEISKYLNVSENTVRTHIARAMKILRKEINIFFPFF